MTGQTNYFKNLTNILRKRANSRTSLEFKSRMSEFESQGLLSPHRLRRGLMAGGAATVLAASAAVVLVASAAVAAPQSGSVVTGAASIAQGASAHDLVINQSSQRATIEWQSFNLAANESVQFTVPTGGATLNRVTAVGASLIRGTVTSNGTLYLVNPNGIVFDAGSRVTAHGFVASTGSISSADFQSGATTPTSFSHFSAPQGMINLNGVITAASVTAYGTQVTVGGTINANSVASRGGEISITASNSVSLTATAKISANGGSGSGAHGGTVNIGGNFQGVGPMPQAQAVTIAAGALVTANAGSTGNGGNVVVWSTGTTLYNGAIEAKGGSVRGDGGSVEVSGKVLGFSGTVSTLAVNGKGGSLLLDPTKLTVQTAAGTVPTTTGSTVEDSTSTGAGSVLTKTAFDSLVTNNAEVTLLADEVNIDIALDISTKVLKINAPVVTFTASGSITGTKLASTGAAVIINAGSASTAASITGMNITAPSVTINATTDGTTGGRTNLLSLAGTVTGNLTLTTGNNINQTGKLTVTGTLSATATGGAIILDSVANSIATLGAISTTGTSNGFSIFNGTNALSLSENISVGAEGIVTLRTTNANISLTKDISISGTTTVNILLGSGALTFGAGKTLTATGAAVVFTGINSGASGTLVASSLDFTDDRGATSFNLLSTDLAVSAPTGLSFTGTVTKKIKTTGDITIAGLSSYSTGVKLYANNFILRSSNFIGSGPITLDLNVNDPSTGAVKLDSGVTVDSGGSLTINTNGANLVLLGTTATLLSSSTDLHLKRVNLNLGAGVLKLGGGNILSTGNTPIFYDSTGTTAGTGSVNVGTSRFYFVKNLSADKALTQVEISTLSTPSGFTVTGTVGNAFISTKTITLDGLGITSITGAWFEAPKFILGTLTFATDTTLDFHGPTGATNLVELKAGGTLTVAGSITLNSFGKTITTETDNSAYTIAAATINLNLETATLKLGTGSISAGNAIINYRGAQSGASGTVNLTRLGFFYNSFTKTTANPLVVGDLPTVDAPAGLTVTGGSKVAKLLYTNPLTIGALTYTGASSLVIEAPSITFNTGSVSSFSGSVTFTAGAITLGDTGGVATTVTSITVSGTDSFIRFNGNTSLNKPLTTSGGAVYVNGVFTAGNSNNDVSTTNKNLFVRSFSTGPASGATVTLGSGNLYLTKFMSGDATDGYSYTSINPNEYSHISGASGVFPEAKVFRAVISNGKMTLNLGNAALAVTMRNPKLYLEGYQITLDGSNGGSSTSALTVEGFSGIVFNQTSTVATDVITIKAAGALKLNYDTGAAGGSGATQSQNLILSGVASGTSPAVTLSGGTTAGRLTISGNLNLGTSKTLISAAAVTMTGAGTLVGTGDLDVRSVGTVGTDANFGIDFSPTATGFSGNLGLSSERGIITIGSNLTLVGKSLTIDTSWVAVTATNGILFNGNVSVTGAGSYLLLQNRAAATTDTKLTITQASGRSLTVDRLRIAASGMAISLINSLNVIKAVDFDYSTNFGLVTPVVPATDPVTYSRKNSPNYFGVAITTASSVVIDGENLPDFAGAGNVNYLRGAFAITATGATSDITIGAPTGGSNRVGSLSATGTDSNSLSLNAGQDVIFTNIVTTGTNITATAGRNITMDSLISKGANGNWTFSAPGDIEVKTLLQFTGNSNSRLTFNPVADPVPSPIPAAGSLKTTGTAKILAVGYINSRFGKSVNINLESDGTLAVEKFTVTGATTGVNHSLTIDTKGGAINFGKGTDSLSKTAGVYDFATGIGTNGDITITGTSNLAILGVFIGKDINFAMTGAGRVADGNLAGELANGIVNIDGGQLSLSGNIIAMQNNHSSQIKLKDVTAVDYFTFGFKDDASFTLGATSAKFKAGNLTGGSSIATNGKLIIGAGGVSFDIDGTLKDGRYYGLTLQTGNDGIEINGQITINNRAGTSYANALLVPTGKQAAKIGFKAAISYDQDPKKSVVTIADATFVPWDQFNTSGEGNSAKVVNVYFKAVANAFGTLTVAASGFDYAGNNGVKINNIYSFRNGIVGNQFVGADFYLGVTAIKTINSNDLAKIEINGFVESTPEGKLSTKGYSFKGSQIAFITALSDFKGADLTLNANSAVAGSVVVGAEAGDGSISQSVAIKNVGTLSASASNAVTAVQGSMILAHAENIIAGLSNSSATGVFTLKNTTDLYMVDQKQTDFSLGITDPVTTQTQFDAILAWLTAGGAINIDIGINSLSLRSRVKSSGGAVTLVSGGYFNHGEFGNHGGLVWHTNNQNFTMNASTTFAAGANGVVGAEGDAAVVVASVGLVFDLGTGIMKAIGKTGFTAGKTFVFVTNKLTGTAGVGEELHNFDESAKVTAFDVKGLLLTQIRSGTPLGFTNDFTLEGDVIFRGVKANANTNGYVKFNKNSVDFQGANEITGDFKIEAAKGISQTTGTLKVTGKLDADVSGGAISLNGVGNQIYSTGAITATGDIKLRLDSTPRKGSPTPANMIEGDITSSGGKIVINSVSGVEIKAGVTISAPEDISLNIGRGLKFNSLVTFGGSSAGNPKKLDIVVVGNITVAGATGGDATVNAGNRIVSGIARSAPTAGWITGFVNTGFIVHTSVPTPDSTNTVNFYSDSTDATLYRNTDGTIKAGWYELTRAFGFGDDLSTDSMSANVRNVAFHSITSSGLTDLYTINNGNVSFTGVNTFVNKGDITIKASGTLGLDTPSNGRLTGVGTLSVLQATTVTIANGSTIDTLGEIKTSGAVTINFNGDLKLTGPIDSDWDFVGSLGSQNRKLNAININAKSLTVGAAVTSTGGPVTIKLGANAAGTVFSGIYYGKTSATWTTTNNVLSISAGGISGYSNTDSDNTVVVFNSGTATSSIIGKIEVYAPTTGKEYYHGLSGELIEIKNAKTSPTWIVNADGTGADATAAYFSLDDFNAGVRFINFDGTVQFQGLKLVSTGAGNSLVNTLVFQKTTATPTNTTMSAIAKDTDPDVSRPRNLTISGVGASNDVKTISGSFDGMNSVTFGGGNYISTVTVIGVAAMVKTISFSGINSFSGASAFAFTSSSHITMNGDNQFTGAVSFTTTPTAGTAANVNLNGIYSFAGGLTIEAGGTVTLAQTTGASANTISALTITKGTEVSFSGKNTVSGATSIITAVGSVTTSGTTVFSGITTLTTTGNVSLNGIYSFAAGLTINAGGTIGLTQSGGTTENTISALTITKGTAVTLSGKNTVSGLTNIITAVGSVTTSDTTVFSGNAILSTTGAISFGGTTRFGSTATVTAGNTVTFGGSTTTLIGASTIVANGANGAISQSLGSVLSSTGTLTLTTTGAITLDGINLITTLGAITANGKITIKNAKTLTLAGNITSATSGSLHDISIDNGNFDLSLSSTLPVAGLVSKGGKVTIIAKNYIWNSKTWDLTGDNTVKNMLVANFTILGATGEELFFINAHKDSSGTAFYKFGAKEIAAGKTLFFTSSKVGSSGYQEDLATLNGLYGDTVDLRHVADLSVRPETGLVVGKVAADIGKVKFEVNILEIWNNGDTEKTEKIGFINVRNISLAAKGVIKEGTVVFVGQNSFIGNLNFSKVTKVEIVTNSSLNLLSGILTLGKIAGVDPAVDPAFLTIVSAGNNVTINGAVSAPNGVIINDLQSGTLGTINFSGALTVGPGKTLTINNSGNFFAINSGNSFKTVTADNNGAMILITTTSDLQLSVKNSGFISYKAGGYATIMGNFLGSSGTAGGLITLNNGELFAVVGNTVGTGVTIGDNSDSALGSTSSGNNLITGSIDGQSGSTIIANGGRTSLAVDTLVRGQAGVTINSTIDSVVGRAAGLRIDAGRYAIVAINKSLGALLAEANSNVNTSLGWIEIDGSEVKAPNPIILRIIGTSNTIPSLGNAGVGNIFYNVPGKITEVITDQLDGGVGKPAGKKWKLLSDIVTPL